MNNKKNIIFPLIFALVMVLGIVLGIVIGRNNSNQTIRTLARNLSGTNNKLNYTLMLIDKYYVDEVNIDSLIDGAMRSLMNELDPHSIYLSAEELAKANESLEGEFDGIGVVFNMSTDTIIVLNVISGGPSYKAGILSGDRIIRIGDSLVAGQKISQDQIMKMLRGKRGTEVEVSLERKGLDKLLPVTITRDKVPIRNLEAAFMISPHTAVVKFSSFARSTYPEIMDALETFRDQGMNNLIFDLRGNTGGYMNSAIQIVNEFLEESQLIVYTMDRYGNKSEEFSDGKGKYQDINVAVLIDEGSASASEILAGAFQDNDRGMVFGRRSFGKGLVQQPIPFPDGSAIRLTTARYYTPTGRSIQKPYDNYDTDMLNRYIHNEMFSPDSIHLNDSLKFITPKGRTVYGGGGIMPDIFVPVDTLNITNYYVKAITTNTLYKFTMEYADRYRTRINEIKTLDDLKEFLDADHRLLEKFVEYAANNGIATNYREIEKSRELLLAKLKGYIGRNTVLQDTGYYYYNYRIDPNALRALEYLENPTPEQTP